MTKHVGLHNAKNIIIMSMQIPNEAHMCLVVFVDSIPTHYREEITKILNTAEGQNSRNFMDELFKHNLPDGRNILQVLHVEGFLKKVQADQTFVTVNPLSKIRLSDLSNLMDKLEAGGDAAKRLAELDNRQGMQPRQRTMITEKAENAATAINDVKDALGDMGKLADAPMATPAPATPITAPVEISNADLATEIKNLNDSIAAMLQKATELNKLAAKRVSKKSKTV